MRSNSATRQFIGGSEDRPVSTAKTSLAKSEKHSVTLSNPDLEPNIENQGVQMCAGTRNAWEWSDKVISSKCRASRPRIGRPSEPRLPIAESCFESSFATSIVGTNTRL